MKVKKFTAGTFAEALKKIKKELGPDAVILSSEEAPGPLRAVEVVAAVEHEGPAPSRPCAAPALPAAVDVGAINDELRSLKDILRRMTAIGCEVKMPAEKMKLFGLLRKAAITEDFAVGLCERATTIDEAKSAIAKELTFGVPGAEARIVLVMGPTGVGKTTTIVKLATHAIRRRKKVALVSLDTFRIGAVQQMSIYARTLGIPLEIVNGPKAIKTALLRQSDRDLIYVDTEGRNVGDRQYLDDLAFILRLGLPVETHLLMGANSDGDFLMRAADRYRNVRVDCLGFTKVDEAGRLGCIFNMARVLGRPVRYVTNGQRVPDDIEFVQPGRLADLILTGAPPPAGARAVNTRPRQGVDHGAR